MSTCYPLIITGSNLVPGSTNTYRYNFSSNVDMSNIDIGLGSASIWFSWRNITDLKQNNKFSIIHPATGATNTTLAMTLPDGGYNISDINNFIRYELIRLGWFIQNNTTNEQIVYAALEVNPSTYQIVFKSYPVPTSLPAGYTAGSAITFPSTTRAPQLVIAQPNFGTVLGFATGTFPAVQQTVLTSTGSTTTPQVSDVTNVVLTLDSAMNPFAPNSRVIHSISPAGAAYASLIKSEPNEVSWIPQQSGWRQSITIQLVNQDLVPLDQTDTDLTIKLLLRMRDQNLLNR